MFAMIPFLLLLATAQSPLTQPAGTLSHRGAAFVPSSTVTAKARVSVRILSPARFGADQLGEAPGASVRNATLADQSGQPHAAKLLEFQ